MALSRYRQRASRVLWWFVRRGPTRLSKQAVATRKSDQAMGIPVQLGSPDRFGYSWENYCDILPEHEGQFIRWTAPMKPEDWKNVWFLDAGCGIGRNSYWPMSYGAA